MSSKEDAMLTRTFTILLIAIPAFDLASVIATLVTL